MYKLYSASLVIPSDILIINTLNILTFKKNTIYFPGDNITAELDCKGSGKHVFNLTSIVDHSKLLNLPEYVGGEDLKINGAHLKGQYIFKVRPIYVYIFHPDELSKIFVFTVSLFCFTPLSPIPAPKVRKRM